MRLGAEPTFSFKQQVRKLWLELKACKDIIVSYRMLESLFGIKKSRISEIVVSNEATERTIPNKRRFSDNDEIVMLLEITDRFQSGKPFAH
jgi:predicted transcriptional regulator